MLSRTVQLPCRQIRNKALAHSLKVSLKLHVADKVSSPVARTTGSTSLRVLLLSAEYGKAHQEIAVQLLCGLELCVAALVAGAHVHQEGGVQDDHERVLWQLYDAHLQSGAWRGAR